MIRNRKKLPYNSIHHKIHELRCRIDLYGICHTLELGLDFLTMLAPGAGPAK